MPNMTAGQDKRHWWVIGGILVLAAMLRLPALETVPPPLNSDEASRGYDAWSILETGADRHGQRWPLFLESYGPGDFTAALTTYITVPFVALLGPTTLAMRLPDALLGVLTVAVLFFWLQRQAGTTTALIAAAVLAVDPWHISLCRTAHESGYTPFLFAFALLAIDRAGLMPRDIPSSGASGCDQRGGSHSAVWALVAGLMLGAHAWAYPATRLFTPFFVVAMLVTYRRRYLEILRCPAGRVTLELFVFGTLIGVFPLIVTAMTHPEFLAARARAALLIYKGYSPSLVVWKFICNYAANIGPWYGFVQCDEMSGTMIPGVGQHLIILASLYLVGLIRMVAGWRSEARRRLLIAWFLLYPVPAAICAEWNPHPMRTVSGMLLFPIVAGMGGEWLLQLAGRWQKPMRQRAGGIAVIAVLASVAHFANAYYREFPRIAREGYQTSLVEATQYVVKHANEADFVLVTNQVVQPYIFVLLYQPVAPRDLAKVPIVATQGLWGFHQVLRVGKYYFAPKNFSDAVDLFRREWQSLPSGAEGFVIDFERPGEAKVGQVLLRIPAGGKPEAPVYLEVRRWQRADIAASAPANGGNGSGGE